MSFNNNNNNNNQMSKSDASRIQSGQATGGKDMSSSGFAARTQSAGDRNANNAAAGGGSGSGQGTSNQGGNTDSTKK